MHDTGHRLRRWLTPGIGVKRWLLVMFAGLVLLALGTAHVIRQTTRDLEPGGVAQSVVDLVTLHFLPLALRGLILLLAGLGLVAVGAYKVARALTEPFRSPADGPLVELIYQKRFLARGPKVVAIGGGTGLSTLLRGLKEHTSNLTAVVAVADDGGSSGVLRDQLGIPPVGDIRRCIAALADAEPLMNELLEYRFPGSLEDGAADDGGGLGGHAVGNLLIAAMTAVEGGDFEEGIRQMNRVLAVRGQVLPATATPLILHAELADGTVIDGQSAIARAPSIARAWITPTDVRASEDALAAIADADLIVLGPGSLYTSLLPSLLLPEIRDAVAASPALRVFVCNVATQRGRDDRLRPRRPRRGARRPRRERDRRDGPRQQPVRGARAGELRRPGGPAALAALVDPGAAARARGRRRSRERPPPRSRPARRGAAEALRPRERQPAALQRRPNGLNPARGAA